MFHSRPGFVGSSTATTFNPEAESFVPATPSKRKAAVRCRSLDQFPRSPGNGQSQRPVISSQLVFGESYCKRSGFESWAENGYLDSGSSPENSPIRPLTDATMRSLADFTNNVSYSKPLSAVLICCDQRTAEPQSARTLRYLPLESASHLGGSHAYLQVQASDAQRINNPSRSDSYAGQWPPGKLPVEIFELISRKLARDDVMAMRLVNREFEQKVSRTLFHTCVVPFNTELYDMIDDTTKHGARPITARASQKSPDDGGVQWLNAKDDRDGKVYRGHGLRVFQGFGAHIKRFGMSFEVDEDQLSRPPVKICLDAIQSYHGSYNWPPLYYARFDNLAGLERTADETSRMKAAFSSLTTVRELALSIDNGLGWLNGPDQSVRARILKRPRTVFGSSQMGPGQQSEAAATFWNALQQSQRTLSPLGDDPKEVNLAYRPIRSAIQDVLGRQNTLFTKPCEWSAIDIERAIPGRKLFDSIGDKEPFGVLYTTPGSGDGSFPFHPFVNPVDLRKEQKEWLLEMDWAQRAFLESYMLAIVDNRAIFEGVTTLNLARLSSRFLSTMSGEPFWNALPYLEDVTILVSPDWRSVEKDDAGIAETTWQMPSDAVAHFHGSLLQQRISNHPTISRLNVGWVGGGEHAEGMYARNSHVLPAPITTVQHSLAKDTGHCLVFPNVEHLTLTNCWMSPITLESLIRGHADKSLKKLILDSVSLTAHPSTPLPVGAAAAAANAVGVAVPNQPNAGQVPNTLAVPPVAPAQAGLPFVILPHPIQPLPPVVGPAAVHAQAQLHILQGGGGWWYGVDENNNNAMGNVPVQAMLQHQYPHFTAGHRFGSWPSIIDQFSPKTTFQSYLPKPEAWEEPMPDQPASALQAIEFRSCGYLKLKDPPSFDQRAIDGDWSRTGMLSPWFHLRYAALQPCTMDVIKDPYMGRIVQHLPHHEAQAMHLAWGFRMGWQENAEDPMWDGLAPGGTGRFSGQICKT